MTGRDRQTAFSLLTASMAVTVIVAASFCAGAVDKSGVAPSVISLPKGPGSIHGLGDAFEPSPGSGTAKYNIGLLAPPAPGGRTPSLNLKYDGGYGNGPLGFGWRVGVESIRRQTENGVPRYDDTDPDVFVNDLNEELTPRADGYYFCKNEKDFVRYRRVGDGWVATLPDGTLQEFGISADGRTTDAATGRVFAWHLERQTDMHGNRILYEYKSFPGVDNQNRRYLWRIGYGPGNGPWTNFHFIVFNYEPRPDMFEDCRAGFIIRTGMRIAEIVIGTQGPDLEGHAKGDFHGDSRIDNLNRKYVMDYRAHEHWSLLSSVTLIGADGITAAPPMELYYTVANPPAVMSAAPATLGSINTPLHLMDKDWVDLIDLDGDGLPDILRTDPFGGPHMAYLNQGEVSTAHGRAIKWGPGAAVEGDSRAWNVNLAEKSGAIAHLADMDADGRADLVYKAGGSVYYFANRSSGGELKWGPRTLLNPDPATSNPPSPYGVENVKTTDLNANKYMDIIQSISVAGGVAYRCWFNLEGQGFSEPATIYPPDGFMLSAPDVVIADFNGDGMPDIVRVTPTRLEVTASLGNGNFAAAVDVALPDWTLDPGQVAKARLEDITGNGLADLVIERGAPGELWYWLNLGNYTLDTRRRITGMPSVYSPSHAIRWADLNGNGTTDVIYADPDGDPRIQMVDIGELIGCVPRPNMLVEIKNGIGRTINIEYATTTEFALADAAAGRPWPDPLPFPVSVVSRIEVDDSFERVSLTELRYHDGYYDPVAKEFRGFARAEQIEVGDANVPTLVSEFHFDVGREVEAMKGNVLREIARLPDGTAFWDETTTWEQRTLGTGIDGTGIVFAYPVARTRDILELGQGVARRIESEFVYDDYGNRIEEREYGVVENGDRTAGNDQRIVSTTFAYNTDAWLLRFPAREEVRDYAGNVVSRTETYYDDETFSGGNFGSVTRGAATLVRAWVDPDAPGAFVNQQRTKYDNYGNAVALLDPLAQAPAGNINPDKGHYRQIQYDDRFHTFPVAEIIHIGSGKEPLQMSVSYNEGFGKPLFSLDYGGNRTTYEYDPLSRFTSSVRPGDTPEFPTVEYEYALGRPAGNGVINYIEKRHLDRTPGTAGPNKRDHYFISRVFVDGLGRTVMEKEEAESDPVTGRPRVAIKEAKLFNARGSAALLLQPCYTILAGDTLDALLEFENIEAPEWRGNFHFKGGQIVCNLHDAHKISIEYDAQLRVIRSTNPDGTFIRSVHEPLLVKSFDENGNDPESKFHGTPAVHVQDGLGRLVRTDEIVRLNDDGSPAAQPVAWSTFYEYRADDLLTRITDAQRNVKWYEYDGLGRNTHMNDMNRGEMRFAYDDASNRVESLDAKGQRITYTYDGVNRLLTENYHDEGLPFSHNRIYDPDLPISGTNRPDVQYVYDQPAGPVDLGNGSMATASGTKGFLSHVIDLVGEEHNSYDERGRVKWTVRRAPDPVSGQMVSYKTEMTYDSQDRLVEFIYPDEDRCTYHYNERNLLDKITGGAASNLGATPYVVAGVAYAPSGQPLAFSYGNGVVATYAYDARTRLSRHTAARADNPANPLIDYAYTLDAVSNIVRMDDLRPQSVRGAGDPRRNTQAYEYDDLYRLTKVQYSFNLPSQPLRNDGHINYRYDRLGNMVSMSSNINHTEGGRTLTNPGAMSYGGEAGAWDRVGRTSPPGATAEPGPHALTDTNNENEQRTLEYDANGNLLELDGIAYTWDFQDRLVAAESAQMRAEYAYDYADNRVVKKVWRHEPGVPSGAPPSSTTVYIGKYYEIGEYGQHTKYVFNGDTRVARVTGTLDGADGRIQRIRYAAGWNLITLAVDAENAVAQLGLGIDPNIVAVYRWDKHIDGYAPVAAADPLPAGSVFWLHAKESGVLAVRGAYEEKTRFPLPFTRGYVSLASLVAVEASSVLPAEVERAWAYNAHSQSWQAQLSGSLGFLSTMPAFIGPGTPIFVQSSAASTFDLPPLSQRVQYYHQDHLGSSNILADAHGNVLKEAVFYPYGEVRSEVAGPAARGMLPNNHLFAQKERDTETGLHFFEARFLVGSLARFNRVDPMVEDVPEAALRDPQLMNAYGYARGNPIVLTDPDGEFAIGAAIGGAIGGAVGAFVGDAKARLFNRQLKRDNPEGYKQLVKHSRRAGALKGVIVGAVVGGVAETIATGGLSLAAGAAIGGAVGFVAAATHNVYLMRKESKILGIQRSKAAYLKTAIIGGLTEGVAAALGPVIGAAASGVCALSQGINVGLTTIKDWGVKAVTQAAGAVTKAIGGAIDWLAGRSEKQHLKAMNQRAEANARRERELQDSLRWTAIADKFIRQGKSIKETELALGII